MTPLPELPDPNAYRPSWIDGCGGRSVLRPMWDLACDVLTDAWRVEPEAAERALQLLVERNRIVAEGAGAVSVAGRGGGVQGLHRLGRADEDPQ